MVITLVLGGLAGDDQVNDVGYLKVGGREIADLSPTPHDDYAISRLHDMFHIVANDDYRTTIGPHALYHL